MLILFRHDFEGIRAAFKRAYSRSYRNMARSGRIGGDVGMPYYNVNPHTLYQSCMSAWISGEPSLTSTNEIVKARAWVEAVNIYRVWEIVQKWFRLLESEEVENVRPDIYWDDGKYPDFAPLTQDVADKFIEELDADILLEKNRFQGRLASEFSRLEGAQRLAFVQECYQLMKSTREINEEAERRVKAGEKFPPQANGRPNGENGEWV